MEQPSGTELVIHLLRKQGFKIDKEKIHGLTTLYSSKHASYATIDEKTERVIIDDKKIKFQDISDFLAKL